MRLTGLEPARRETLDPKSSASTNSATGASLLYEYLSVCKGNAFFLIHQKISCKFYDCVFPAEEILGGEPYLVIGGDAEFGLLVVAVVAGTG